jgi:hypothetical protein
MTSGKYIRTKEHLQNMASHGFHKGNKIHLGRKRSEETKKKLSISHKGLLLGDKHPRWKGGKSKRYLEEKSNCNKEYKEWRTAVFIRDNWTCQTCQKRGVYLEAHHIKRWVDYPELRLDVNNGVTLCYECHQLTKRRFKI